MLYNYQRRTSSVTEIGETPLGGNHPIRVQSMTNTSTMDTEACVAQAKAIIERGGAYVRLTAQGVREAENLQFIHEQLRQQGYQAPLVADIHFNPKAADAAALYVEKVRINPGNYVDTARQFKEIAYDDASYALELQKIRERFLPFVELCRAQKTAIRIGVNHGSLSDRIMSRYGNSPSGMVESAMEFLRLCQEVDFPHVVLSMKSSNTVVMVQAVRLLVAAMEQEGMAYPLHLGVTEAGDGEDGRIKSAVGIGALLADGLGDTLRVSLSEAPELEIPVAKKLVDHITQRADHAPLQGPSSPHFTPYEHNLRPTHAVGNAGHGQVPIVIADYSQVETLIPTQGLQPDAVYFGTQAVQAGWEDRAIVDPHHANPPLGARRYYRVDQLEVLREDSQESKFLGITLGELQAALADPKSPLQEVLRLDPNLILVAELNHINVYGEFRALAFTLQEAGFTHPLLFRYTYNTEDAETLQVMMGADTGGLLLDGLCDGLWISNEGQIATHLLTQWMLTTLQAARRRTSKTEFISCPGCGRTLFDLQQTIARVKAATDHLIGLKIGIMGCIVNGPGEMADADFGYVGAARGKISLYKGKTCVEKNIPEAEAVDKLIELIKVHGAWIDRE